MPWDPTEKLMTRAVGLGDISQAVGYASGDIGTLIVNGIINMFSRWKPMNIASFQPTDRQREDVRWGVIAKATNDRDALYSMSLDWTYERSVAPHFNSLDFDKYYGRAPVPFQQANGLELVVDVVAEGQDPAKFYMFMNAGALANKAFSNASGIDTSADAVPSNRMGNCLAVEDIGFYDADGGGWHTLLGAQLGLVIFSTSGQFKGEIWATHNGAAFPVAELQAVESDMYIVSTANLMDNPNLGLGEYVAVACAKKVEDNLTFYLCAYNGNAAYPARFPMEIGGLERYPARAVGLGTSAVASTVTSILTMDSDVYVTVRLTNNSGRTLNILIGAGSGSNPKFTIEARITGSVVDMQTGNTITIDRTQTNATIAYPSTDQTVNAGASVDLVYKLTRIWSNSATEAQRAIESGSVNINAKLIFKNIAGAYFPSQGMTPLTVTYGSV